MRLTFQLRFHTGNGQSLFLTGNHSLLGNGEFAKAIPLHYLNPEAWSLMIDLPSEAIPDRDIVYNYVLRNPDGSLIYDWGSDKVINPATFHGRDVLLIDSWNHADAVENAFYTEPFKQVLLKHNPDELRPILPAATHAFKVKAPLLEKGETMCLLGNAAALHAWNTTAPILMRRDVRGNFFVADVDLSQFGFPAEYKYGVYDLDRRKFIAFENVTVRKLDQPANPQQLTIVNDGFAALPSTMWKGAGVAIPLFSLRSENGFGIGEFADLKLLVDWSRAVGLRLIQLLPINDTTSTFTWTDSYPYAAISAFALNPVYLNLGQVADANNKIFLKDWEQQRARLNSLDVVDYEAVLKLKFGFLRKIYPSQKASILKCDGYREFFERNEGWLLPYAVFCHLRDKFGTAEFQRWPAFRQYRADEIATLSAPHSESSDKIDFYCFLQYHLHLQLREATDYARAQGVILKGDIPIGISRTGVDAWQQPELYHMDSQAGAPPDDFGVKGQNWNFPTYNWDRMKEDGFAWWKQRFEQMSNYFDAFRIDHILGFFRIWSIPLDAVEGILGRFDPAIPVRLEEFRSRGIWFERDRYVEPYITDEILRDLFGSDSEYVKATFLVGAQLRRQGEEKGAASPYALKPEFATQRMVEAYFAELEPTERNEKMRIGLYDLISNVILFEVPGSEGNQFHFRFAEDKTSSFKHLDPNTQAGLKALCIDYFFRRQDAFWMREAMQRLPALKRSTNMLICGEDLGLVPACVPDVMRQLGLLSLEVQRMPKDSSREFSSSKDAPYLSVVTPGTHDMSTIRGWWEEDRTRTQNFYNNELRQSGEAPSECEAWINKAIILQHLDSPAMWAIFQLQDLLGMDENLRRKNPADERINVPSNPRNYWRYRMHLTLESLVQAREFNKELKRLIRQTKREGED
jgi:4-alpha-glucanotransferase